MADDIKTSDSGGVAAAAEAKARAESAGAVGPGTRGTLTRAQLVTRDVGIIAALHAGIPVREIAKDYKITARSVQRIRERFELAPTELDVAPLEVLHEMLRDYALQILQFSRLAEDTIDRAPAVAVAAMRSAAEMRERRLVLLQSVGQLPRDLKLFRSEQEMRNAGRRLQELLLQAVDEEWPARRLWDEWRAWGAAELGVPLEAEPAELPPGDD